MVSETISEHFKEDECQIMANAQIAFDQVS